MLSEEDEDSDQEEAEDLVSNSKREEDDDEIDDAAEIFGQDHLVDLDEQVVNQDTIIDVEGVEGMQDDEDYSVAELGDYCDNELDVDEVDDEDRLPCCGSSASGSLVGGTGRFNLSLPGTKFGAAFFNATNNLQQHHQRSIGTLSRRNLMSL